MPPATPPPYHPRPSCDHRKRLPGGGCCMRMETVHLVWCGAQPAAFLSPPRFVRRSSGLSISVLGGPCSRFSGLCLPAGLWWTPCIDLISSFATKPLIKTCSKQRASACGTSKLDTKPQALTAPLPLFPRKEESVTCGRVFPYLRASRNAVTCEHAFSHLPTPCTVRG